MSDENAVIGYFNDFFSNFIEFWGITDHIIINPRQTANGHGNSAFGVNQAVILLDNLSPVMYNNSYFGYSVSLNTHACGFDVNDRIFDIFGIHLFVIQELYSVLFKSSIAILYKSADKDEFGSSKNN